MLDEGGEIFRPDVLNPYIIRKDHDVRALCAEVHASRLTNPDLPDEMIFFYIPLQGLPKRLTPATRATNCLSLTSIRADEQDPLIRNAIFFHRTTLL